MKVKVCETCGGMKFPQTGHIIEHAMTDKPYRYEVFDDFRQAEKGAKIAGRALVNPAGLAEVACTCASTQIDASMPDIDPHTQAHLAAGGE